jgi:hypothetical protein
MLLYTGRFPCWSGQQFNDGEYYVCSVVVSALHLIDDQPRLAAINPNGPGLASTDLHTLRPKKTSSNRLLAHVQFWESER